MDKSLQLATDLEIAQEVGRRLRALRKTRDWSLNEAAEKAGLDRSTVSRAERGDNPTLLTILRLLRAYGRLGAIEGFIPEPEVSPMKLLRKRRGRGSGA